MAIYESTKTVERPEFLGGGSWSLSRLTDIVVLMGKNGSGKSFLLRNWRDTAPENAHYVVPERTGDISFVPHYFEQESTGRSRKDSYGGNFVAEYRRRIITRVQTYFMQRGNFRGEEVSPCSPEELERILQTLTPDFRVKLQPSTPPFTVHRKSTDEPITQIEHLSSGEAQLLTIGLDILTIAAMWEIGGTSPRTMLIDEPDAHVHSDLQARFADFLVQVVERFNVQMMVATHSTALMSALALLGGDKSSVIYLKRQAANYKAKQFSKVERELATCLGGSMLIGPLFAAPILLVEGDDDFRIWSQVPRHHVINLAVLPCQGDEIKKHQRSLEDVLASLCEKPKVPMGYALLDGDKAVPTASPGNEQDYVRFIGLRCHEAENLYLTDNVLQDLDLNWESACNMLVAHAAECGNKAEALAACKTWDRAQVNLKGLMGEISRILDPKGVAWTVRVGVAIGRERPEGHLAEFLGLNVLSALWPSASESGLTEADTV